MTTPPDDPPADLVAAPEPAHSDVLHYRDGDGTATTFVLDARRPRLVLGRSRECDLVLEWDPTVSRAHALVERVGDGWLIADSGLSRNGTFVGGDRIAAGRWLEHGATIRLGATVLTYRRARPTGVPTEQAGPEVRPTEAEMRVLRALCAPMAEDSSMLPASNRDIADALFLSEDRVKELLGDLFRKLGVREVRPGAKRHALARRARERGLV